MPRQPAPTATVFSKQPEFARDHAVKVRNNMQWLEALLDETAHFAASARRLSHVASSVPHPELLGIDTAAFNNACQTLQAAGAKLNSIANAQTRAKLHNSIINFTGEITRASSNIYLEIKRRSGDKNPIAYSSPNSPASSNSSKYNMDHMPKILTLLENADCAASNLLEERLQELIDSIKAFTAAASNATTALSKETGSIDLTAAMEEFLLAGMRGQLPPDCLDYRVGYSQVLYNDSDNDDYIVNAYNRGTTNPTLVLSSRESLSGSGLGNSYKARSPAFGSKGPRSPSSKTTTLLQAIVHRQQRLNDSELEDEGSGSD